MKTVFFDLDGTLVDTAPDLASALNCLVDECGFSPLAFERIRSHVSRGSAALVKLAFGEALGDDEFERRRLRLLDIYSQCLSRESRLFPGAERLLDALQDAGLNWGVVTNKPGWLTDPLLRALGIYERAACVVSGDTTDQRKPHPKPLLHAARLVGSKPRHCLYVGDDPRDIKAGNAAGMVTLVATYGYIDGNETIDGWGADGRIDHPEELLAWLTVRESALRPRVAQ
jgi:N-acetyl-D-muramate 6-phosphate phosphatase